ncbi:MAG: CAP domain-containing protein [Chlorobiaceae bacterium]|nr:CAP domain-containing protein [Chlorobiaceae bacterium]
MMGSVGISEGRSLQGPNSSGSGDRKYRQWYAEADDGDRPATPVADVPASPAWTARTIDTTSGVDYMARTERDVVIELNMMRTDPARYAMKYLVPLRGCYQGRILKYPGDTAISTNEGLPALEECIRELKRARPVSPLSPREGLTLAARDHVLDQGPTGAIGHTGSDGSSLFTRLSRYGKWEFIAGENISYGYSEARKIVVALLIDDGVPSRGHRKNLLNQRFNLVGVDIGPHQAYGHMCVMDFVGGYRPN